LSNDALAESVENGVSTIAAEQFDIHIPIPDRPFEFGVFELSIILLFAVGFGARYLRPSFSEGLRWATQVFALLIIGFWENSPITLAKITALLSGYFPDPRANLALYLLIGGFTLSILLLGKDIYCLHVCPFGAAQRFVNAIGGKRLGLPLWSVRLMNQTRNLIVLAAIAAALAQAQPARASYEPFAALFALKGTTLQWFLLLIILIVSFFIRRPWCHYFCPMRSCERALLDIRQKSTVLIGSNT
jgi:polyferredoxin